MPHTFDEHIRQRLEALPEEPFHSEDVWNRIERPSRPSRRRWSIPLGVGTAAVLGLLVGYLLHQPTTEVTRTTPLLSKVPASSSSVRIPSVKDSALVPPNVVRSEKQVQMLASAPVEPVLVTDSSLRAMPAVAIQPTPIPESVPRAHPAEAETFEATVTLTIPETQTVPLRKKSILARLFRTDKRPDTRPRWQDFQAPTSVGKVKTDSLKHTP
ncbi:hypothetical protein [Siphonobacter sp.]|uniref:hypothetical protein n=1 Tax=Siphonobacter sp. TaxID=1869184 RepID=UPI003B3B659B